MFQCRYEVHKFSRVSTNEKLRLRKTVKNVSAFKSPERLTTRDVFQVAEVTKVKLHACAANLKVKA